MTFAVGGSPPDGSSARRFPVDPEGLSTLAVISAPAAASLPGAIRGDRRISSSHTRRLAGPRTPDHLPPHLLSEPLVTLDAGTLLHARDPRPVRTHRSHPAGGRRHRHRAPWPPRLRQGLPPRPGPLHTLLHRVPLGTHVGRAGVARPLPFRHKALGAAPAGGAVPARGRRPRGEAAAQDAAAVAAADAPGPAPLVPRAVLHPDRGRQ